MTPTQGADVESTARVAAEAGFAVGADTDRELNSGIPAIQHAAKDQCKQDVNQHVIIGWLALGDYSAFSVR